VRVLSRARRHLREFGYLRPSTASFAIAVVAGLLPAVVSLWHSNCMIAPCDVPSFLTSGGQDVRNIAHYSSQIAHGASPLAYPDVPLRYLPLAGVMIPFLAVGVDPLTVTIWYSLIAAFVLIPGLIYLLTREISEHAAVVALLIYALGVHLVPPWDPTMWVRGKWQYIYAIPPMILALRAARRQKPTQSGIWLGVMALIEILLAGVVAAGIGLSLLMQREFEGFKRTAVVSILVFSPGLLWVAKWHEHWSSHAPPLEFSLNLTSPLLMALVGSIASVIAGALVLARKATYRRRIIEIGSLPLLVTTSLLVFLTAIALFGRAYYLKIMIAYPTEFLVYICAGVGVAALKQ